MKRVLILLIGMLSLSACTPACWRSGVPPVALPAQASDGTRVTLTSGPAYQTVVGYNGAATAPSSTLTLFGQSLRVNDRRCAPSGLQIVCQFGELLPNGKRTVYATGVQVARFTVTRVGGDAITVETR